MFRPLSLAGTTAAVALAAFSWLPSGVKAQGVDQTFERINQLQELAPTRQRAINLARNSVVKLNGGLGRYMPAACMFATGRGVDSCLIQQNDQGFLFRFNGGSPGWQQLGTAPTTSSEILISPDGRSVVQLIYNGPLR